MVGGNSAIIDNDFDFEVVYFGENFEGERGVGCVFGFD